MVFTHMDPYWVFYCLIHTYVTYFILLLENLEIPSYADDTTIYTINEPKESVTGLPESSSSLLFGWFTDTLKAYIW